MPQPSSAAMAPRLVVIGTSAGGLAPLRAIARVLPAGLAATVLDVMHGSPTASSVLPQILARVAQAGVAPGLGGVTIVQDPSDPGGGAT